MALSDVLTILDQEFMLKQAKAIVAVKLHNSRVLLQRLNRQRTTEQATQAIAELAQLIQQVAKPWPS
ncbi:CRISPR-associated endonuclease Cas1 [Oscillatoria sp. FACHB-1407]|uniref:CRISPR-associated endonuclease Cas1 n=1 Tax=Oscillatoria sp. FACHB-1407 TaxID=2692847 RepID=UPI002107B8CE|nr:CRISPR-associated endonuclease Cas1 [Oscillatoria sp. FACHB-1407]